MLAVSLVTLGSPSQLTGGYLYHRRMAELAAVHEAEVRFVSLPARLRRGRHARAHVLAVDSIAAAFLVASRPRPPIVAVVHQAPGGIDHGAVRARLQAPLDLALYRRAHRVIAASQALADELVAAGLRADAVVVVPPGCDVAARPEVAPDLRQGRSAAFVSVGNWVARKGILDLVEAFARLPDEAAVLHLAGRSDVDKRYAAKVKHRLAQPDLAGRVLVHGPVSLARVGELLAGADAFVLPSVREPYGTVYGEALAAGVPVVGWRAGNLPHLAEDGREGVVLEPGDLGGLSAALARLAGDPAYRERLRQGARARGRALPTWEDSAKTFFTVLRESAG